MTIFIDSGCKKLTEILLRLNYAKFIDPRVDPDDAKPLKINGSMRNVLIL